MKIATLKTTLVRLPVKPAITTPLHHIASVETVLVEIGTDTGLQGLSYLWCFGPQRARALELLVHDLFGHVVGMQVHAREAVFARLWREMNFLGRTGAILIAASAIDTALWDLAGQEAGRPVWALLGGSGRPVKAYCGGFFLSESVDSIVAEANARVAQGFRAVKMRCGAADWIEDIDRVAAIRDAVGPDVEILIDVVQGWDVPRALKVGRALDRFDITYIEDPVAFDDLAGMARIAEALDIPLAAGENTYGRAGFRQLIEARAIDVAMIDLQRAGGISEWMKIAALVQAHGLPVVPHVFQEISIHMLSALPGAPFIEVMDWWTPLFVQKPQLRDGAYVPPRDPGLGLTLDRDAIEPLIVRETT